MFDKEKFSLALENSGLKKRFVAKQIGIAYGNFLKKCNGAVMWKVDEALNVSKVLRMSSEERDSIFFA